eukprot:TRINITY_DN17080_c0_g1_i1.p1 TRINITY_DN17080_c0_g1~~TRINITY_DN17080_c0_g1_i1.p1  ORF type:complete len:221 (+),score=47.12 TRINITY_DN17080_c0_g1_i1:75-665(+)
MAPQTSEWIADMKIAHQSYEVGDKVESIFRPTNEWYSATISAVLDNKKYLIRWTPAEGYEFKADRIKRADEMRPVKPPTPPKEDAPEEEPEEEKDESEEEEEEVLCPHQALRDKAGVEDKSCPFALMRQRDLVAHAFETWDADGSGMISEDELVAVLRDVDARFDQEAVAEIMEAADVNKDGHIDYMEFTCWLFNT